MDAYQGLALDNNEIDNLREQMAVIDFDLRYDNRLLSVFIRNPIAFLETYNIKILKYILSTKKLKKQFTVFNREILIKARGMVNRCLICKISILMIMSAVLAKLELAWENCIEAINKFADSINKYFGDTGVLVDSYFDKITSQLDNLTPPALALAICRHYNQCPKKDPNIIRKKN